MRKIILLLLFNIFLPAAYPQQLYFNHLSPNNDHEYIVLLFLYTSLYTVKLPVALLYMIFITNKSAFLPSQP